MLPRPPARVASLFLIALTSSVYAQDASQPAPVPAADPSTAPSAPLAESIPESQSPPPAGAPSIDSVLNPEKPWVIRIDPMVWWVSPAGDLKLPSSSATAGDEVELDRLNLDTPQFTPAGSISINADRFRFYFFGAGYTSDADGVADQAFRLGDISFANGDPYRSSFDLGYYEITAGYRFLSYNFTERTANQDRAIEASVDVYGFAGGRLYDLDISIEDATGTSSGTDQFFGDIIVGARAEFLIARDFNINLEVSGGGMGDSDRSSYSFDVKLFGEWRPWTNVGVEFGWRHTQYSFEDGSDAAAFEYDGSLAGVFGGVVIRF